MRFLVDANMPRSVMALLDSLDHDPAFARDISLGDAPDALIANHARILSAAIITRDLDFADIRNYPTHEYNGIIVLRMPDDAIAHDIVHVLERFLRQTKLVAQLPGHLVILETDRVRFRPALE